MPTDATATIECHPLTPERLPDFLDFFDQRAFPDNPKWRSCYCHFPHADHATVVWKMRSAEQNRAATCERIGARTMTGWLAYDAGIAVGWCNAGPRRFVDGFVGRPDPDAERVGSIACFVVAPGYRGRGIATQLLDATCRGFASEDFVWAEAYPLRDASGAAGHHLGPLAMYLAAGFEVVATNGNDVTVRRRLA